MIKRNAHCRSSRMTLCPFHLFFFRFPPPPNSDYNNLIRFDRLDFFSIEIRMTLAWNNVLSLATLNLLYFGGW